MVDPTPKVFISYSWTSASHEALILRVATELQTRGVQVILDKWDLLEGQDTYHFMEKSVTDPTITKVLIFSDRRYVERADGRKGGVGTESQIISQDLYSKTEQTKFIPIACELDESGAPFLPVFLRNRKYIDLSSDERFFAGFELIERAIHGRQLFSKPPLGVVPKYLTSEAPTRFSTLLPFRAVLDAYTNDRPTRRARQQEFFDALANDLFNQRIASTSQDFDDHLLESIRAMKELRDQLTQVIKVMCLHAKDATFDIAPIVSLIEQASRKQEVSGPTFNGYDDNVRFLLLEMFLYLVAYLVKHDHYVALNELLGERFFVRSRRRPVDFTFLSDHFPALDDYRPKRLKLSSKYVVANLLKDRADNAEVGWEDIAGIDFALAVRTMIACLDGANSRWYPRTIPFARHREPYDVFIRAAGTRGRRRLLQLLGVSSIAVLKEKIAIAESKGVTRAYTSDGWPIFFSELMALDELAD